MQKNLGRGLVIATAGSAIAQLSAVQPSDLLLFQKGSAVLKPQFGVTESFNDNITYRSQDKQADLLTTISPGLTFQFGRRDFNFFDLSYTYDRLIYAENPVFDANQQHIVFRTKFQKNRLTLDGGDNVDFLSSPIGGGYSASLGNQVEGVSGVGGARVDRLTWADSYRLTWDASERTDLYGRFNHYKVDYEDSLPLYDSDTLIGTLGFEYRPFTKTYFFGETYYGSTENAPFTNGPEYPSANFIGFFVGTRGQFTEKLQGTVKAGFEHRYYSDDGPSLDAPVVEASVDYQFSERTLLSAGYSRRQYESVQYQRSPYTTDSLWANWAQQIGADGRLRGNIRASYNRTGFDASGQLTSQRTDEIIAASLTLSYDIKLWMRAFGGYNFEHLNSTLPTVVGYDVNRITLGLQIGY